MAKEKDWKVKLYNGNDKVIGTFAIKGRTEHDAHSEAENEVDRRSQFEDIEDWTMTAVKKKLKKK